MVFAVPGPRLLRWLGVEIGPPDSKYDGDTGYSDYIKDKFGGIRYYATNRR